MLELCPQGHETSIFFTHLFLERLPAELQITSGEDDHQNVRALAKKADALWSLHGMKASFSASVASLVGVNKPFLVAAVSSRGSSGSGSSSGLNGRSSQASSSRQGSQQPGSQQATGESKAAASLLPKELARILSSLCMAHFNHGEKAFS